MNYKLFFHPYLVIMFFCIIFGNVSPSLAATDVKSIYVAQNSTLLTFCQGDECRIIRLDASPEIKNDHLFVPLRAVSEELGATVKWNATLGRVDIQKGFSKIELYIASSKVIRNGKIAQQAIHPYIKNNRTMVPLRFVSETLGYFVFWKGSPMEVRISSQQIPENPW